MINLLSKKIKSELYNVKLLLRVLKSELANQYDLQELINLMLNGKKEIFDAIVLIFGNL